MKKQQINKLITTQSNKYAFLTVDRFYSSQSSKHFLIELIENDNVEAVSYKIVCDIPFTQTFVKVNLNVLTQYDETTKTQRKTFYFLTDETVKNIFTK